MVFHHYPAFEVEQETKGAFHFTFFNDDLFKVYLSNLELHVREVGGLKRQNKDRTIKIKAAEAEMFLNYPAAVTFAVLQQQRGYSPSHTVGEATCH